MADVRCKQRETTEIPSPAKTGDSKSESPGYPKVRSGELDEVFRGLGIRSFPLLATDIAIELACALDPPGPYYVRLLSGCIYSKERKPSKMVGLYVSRSRRLTSSCVRPPAIGVCRRRRRLPC